MTDKAKPKPRTKVARVPPEVLLKTDEQLWQILRLARKAEAFDTLCELLRDLDSIDAQLKQIVRIGEEGGGEVMEMHLQAERIAIERARKLVIQRIR